MANTLTEAIPYITSRTLAVLREQSIMPRLVNNSFSTDAQEQGDTINIPVTNAQTTRAVTPGQTHPTSGLNDVIPTKKTITLNQWHESAFVMTDKELKEIVDGFQPRVLDEAVRAIANKVDSDILSLYQQVYQHVGTAGNSPFQNSFLEAQEASRVLSSAKAPMQERYVVVDPYAHANLLGLPVLQRVDQSGSNEVLRDGVAQGTRALGFDWYTDQNTPTHDTNASGTYAIDAIGAVGDTTIVVDDGAGAAPTSLVVGDKLTIAGSTQQYTVTAVAAGTPSVNEDTYTISPALDQVIADGDAVTVVATDYVANMAFHRDAIGFASRPLLDVNPDDGGIIQSISDPVSGLSLRLEVQRLYKQTQFSIDILYGYTLVRPELACVIFG